MRRPSPSARDRGQSPLFVALGGPAQAGEADRRRRHQDGARSARSSSRTARSRRATCRARAVRALTATPGRARSRRDKLADDAVTTRALAPGSVLTGTVGDDSLTAADLAPNSVGADEVDGQRGRAGRDPQQRRRRVGDRRRSRSTAARSSTAACRSRDVARWTGSFSWPIPDARRPASATVAPVLITGAQIAGDLLLVSPTTAWPRDLVYTANGTGSETEFKVQACNRGHRQRRSPGRPTCSATRSSAPRASTARCRRRPTRRRR